MERFLAVVDATNNWVGKVFSFLVIVILFVTLYEVILRFVFNKPTAWGHNIAAMTFSVYGILLGGYCLLHNTHVKIDILYARLSARGKAIADLATAGLGFTFIIALLWFGIPWVWGSLQLQERTFSAFPIPLYPFKMIFMLGVFLILIQLIAKFIRDLQTAVKKIGVGE